MILKNLFKKRFVFIRKFLTDKCTCRKNFNEVSSDNLKHQRLFKTIYFVIL